MKLKGGWIAAGVLCLALGGAYLYDSIEAKKYEYELVKTSSSQIIADGESTVRITVKLSKNDKPVEGHTIYIYASNGTLPASRCVTDADGMITFRYYPYVYLNDELTPLEDVTIYLQDESNSTFFMVNAEAKFTFPVVKSETESVHRDWQDLSLEEEDVG